MVRINFLPYRQQKRQQLKAAFFGLMLLFVVAALLLAAAVGAWNARQASLQDERNHLLQNAIGSLDQKIVSIASLKQDIARLKARAQAVAVLQHQRNEAVHLLDELIKQTPQGVYLKAFKQEERSCSITGYAQSQERVAGFLSKLGSQSRWLEKPELIEIRRDPVEQGGAVEFTISVGIKRPAAVGLPLSREGEGSTAKRIEDGHF